jgi:replicative DNA helicase
MGKTALALDIAANVAVDQGKSVTVCSLEMTKEQLFSRFLARRLGVPAWKLEKGSFDDADFERIGSVLDGFADHPLYIDDDADTSLVNIRSKARRQQMQHGLDLLIVDYLQLIEVTDRLAGDTQTQRVTYISKSLKQLGRSRLSMQTDGRHGGSGMAFPSADSSPHNCRLGRTFFDR